MDKWILKSTTIWGLIIMVLTTVVPIINLAFGTHITPADITGLGDEGKNILNSLGGIIGAIMVFVGRIKASVPLTLVGGK